MIKKFEHWNQSSKLSDMNDKLGIFDDLKEELDNMNIVELVEKYNNIEMVTREGYGGENKNGFVPLYLEERLTKEAYNLENSYHSYGTWDHYSLYRPKEESLLEKGKAIIKINVNVSRGSTYCLKLGNYESITVVKNVIKY